MVSCGPALNNNTVLSRFIRHLIYTKRETLLEVIQIMTICEWMKYNNCILHSKYRSLFVAHQESSQRNGAQQITKQGWLYKGPDNGLETSIMSFTRVRWILSQMSIFNIGNLFSLVGCHEMHCCNRFSHFWALILDETSSSLFLQGIADFPTRCLPWSIWISPHLSVENKKLYY